MFKGDSGNKGEDSDTDDINNRETYVEGPFGSDPDSHRHGILYLGIGMINLGLDREGIRHVIQNVFAHDIIKRSPYFRDLRGTDKYNQWGGNRFFFLLGSGGLWY